MRLVGKDCGCIGADRMPVIGGFDFGGVLNTAVSLTGNLAPGAVSSAISLAAQYIPQGVALVSQGITVANSVIGALNSPDVNVQNQAKTIVMGTAMMAHQEGPDSEAAMMMHAYELAAKAMTQLDAINDQIKAENRKYTQLMTVTLPKLSQLVTACAQKKSRLETDLHNIEMQLDWAKTGRISPIQQASEEAYREYYRVGHEAILAKQKLEAMTAELAQMADMGPPVRGLLVRGDGEIAEGEFVQTA